MSFRRDERRLIVGWKRRRALALMGSPKQGEREMKVYFHVLGGLDFAVKSFEEALDRVHPPTPFLCTHIRRKHLFKLRLDILRRFKGHS
mmetsp:Transcript_59/g.84  ORF Transcript_59/g.84 Transcript_59/m.84 type:complete len:89 (+) Transcript_59:207-473(+)